MKNNNNIQNKYLNLYTINHSINFYNIFNNLITNKSSSIIPNDSNYSTNHSYEYIKQHKQQHNNIQEIFIIGKIDIFKRRMDKLYYDFLNKLINNSNFTISLMDINNCEKNKTLDYYINKYCKTKNPIIYNIIYTNPNDQIISNLSESKLIKIYEIEDCYEIDNLINNIKYNNYDYIIYRYNCEQMDYIISQFPYKHFIHFPHYIDTSIFSNTKSIKKYDILIYGNLSDWYPFRKRLLKLVKENNYNYYHLEHPGYNEYNEKNENTFTIKKDLSLLINQSKLTICTCSIFQYFVKKYIEISLSGSIICGDFPNLENNIYLDNMCNINNNMSDNDILTQINKYLSLSPIEYNNIINNSYNITLSNFSHDIGINKFNKFINNILDTQNTLNNQQLDNQQLDNQILDNQQLDNQQLDNQQLDNQQLDNQQLDNQQLDNKYYNA